MELAKKTFYTRFSPVFLGGRFSGLCAFTLAEVLITLGIIGVVAAMTLPVLINNYGNSVLETQNRKAQTVLANGVKMLMAKDGVTDLEYASLKNCNDDKNCLAEEIKKSFKIISDNTSTNDLYSSKYKFTDGEKEFWTDSSFAYVFTVADGITYGIVKDENKNSMTFVADVNGNKTPNRGSKDLCRYTISNAGTLSKNCEIMESWSPAATPVCDKDHLEFCTTEEDCKNAYPSSGHEGSCWINGECKIGEVCASQAGSQ